MAELIVHNPPKVTLKASNSIGVPEGDIELAENNKTYDVSEYATATTRIPEPTGTKEIVENGVHDVKDYAFADVKIPEPSGAVTLDENNRSYDVTDYKTANVAIPEGEKTVTPSTTRQEVTPDNGLLSKVTVLPAPLEERTVTPTTEKQTITPSASAIGLSKVTVNATPLEVKSVTPTAHQQVITPTAPNIGLSSVTVEAAPLPIEEKDVNFYDYDGTVLYAYTAQEALALSALPEAPTHEGLTFQGWNRTLAQLQAYVTDCGIGDAGAIYITDDGVTRLYLEIGEDVSLNYELYVSIYQGTVSVEVDGVVLGSATSSAEEAEDLVISFTVPHRGKVRVDLKFNGSGDFTPGSEDEYPVFGSNNDQCNSLVKVEFGGSTLAMLHNMFLNCRSLKTVIFNSAPYYFGAEEFTNCSSLKAVVFPSRLDVGSGIFESFVNCVSLSKVILPASGLSSLSVSAFQNCVSLNNVVIPDSVTSINSKAFQNCASLNNVVIPDSVTSINSKAFGNCISLLVLDLSHYTDPNSIPSVTGSNLLKDAPSEMKIFVADQQMMTAFSNATNWSAYADRFQIKEATP